MQEKEKMDFGKRLNMERNRFILELSRLLLEKGLISEEELQKVKRIVYR